MLWKVRATLPDRPGTLARLARECGEAGVNILGVQVFPGVSAVTDEIVVRAPAGWRVADIESLLARAGAEAVITHPCAEGALVDQPARYVQAARSILAAPARSPEVVAALFDADSGAGVPSGPDVMELVVGDVIVQIHREAPFTGTEHARGAAMAELVNDVLSSLGGHPGDRSPRPASRHLGAGVRPTYVVSSMSIAAMVDGTVVGRALLMDEQEPGSRNVMLEVDPSWRRRGIGSRLLLDAARLARERGDDELLLVTGADNQAVLPMVLGSGLRGRIRMGGEELTVRVPLRDLAPATR
jgi:GNAT superfamily N-acetyltransferase